MRSNHSPEMNRGNGEHAELSPVDKVTKVLAMFGNETARQNFLETCRSYSLERAKHSADHFTENYRGKERHSPPRRAAFHNQIMETLKRLSLKPKIAPLEESILREMADRDIAADYLLAYLETHRPQSADDDEEDDDSYGQVKRGSGSDVAYFHRLGKGE